MTVFVFPNVKQLTERYHSSGGLVVVARSREHAEQLIALDKDIKPTDAEWASVITYPIAGDADARVFVFPDAGCC